MSISELGSLGEFVGSLAVLVTLIILVVQVRGARTELSTQMTREIKRHNNEAFHQLIQRSELVDLHIQAQIDFDALSDSDKVAWQLWLFTWINQTEDAWLARQRGLPHMDWVAGYMLGIALVLRSDGGRIVWPGLRAFFDKSFVEAVDRCIEEDNTTFLQSMLG